MLFKGTFTAFGAAITDIRRFRKFGADILFIENAGRGTFAAGPAKPAFAKGTFRTNHLSRALMLKGQAAVIESPAIGAAFFKADVIFHFFGDGGAILVKKPANRFKAFAIVQHSFNGDSGVKSQMFLYIHKDILPAGMDSHIYIKILTESLERLNSIIESEEICRIKFHRGVEFNPAIE